MLTATGKSFSSGFHIGALVERNAGKDDDYDRDAFERTVDQLEGLRVPTIAALNGSVYGGATDLALACDFRIGVEGMQLLMPAARLGIVYYESGIRRYVTRLGVGAAKKLFMTAQPIDAEEMLRIGYLDEIVPADQLMARVEALAATLTRERTACCGRAEAGGQRDRRRHARPRRARRYPGALLGVERP